jgi:small-conductance mechanosensitive channel
MKRFLRRTEVALLSMGLALISPMAQAQSNLGQEVLESSTDALKELLDSLVTLLQVVMGLGAIVVLAIVIFQVFKGEREAAQKLAWWVVGLTLGFTLLTVVQNLIA